jgi:hypothetical protein
MAVWYIFTSFGTILPALVCGAKKNLATLLHVAEMTKKTIEGVVTAEQY